MDKNSVSVDHYDVKNGEWLDVGKYKKHVCCDCALTHKVRYRIQDGKMQESWTRDDRSTDKERKREKIRVVRA